MRARTTDPMFHSEVIGAKSRNLDLFLLGRRRLCRLLRENGKDCGVSIIEGVMGTMTAWPLQRRQRLRPGPGRRRPRRVGSGRRGRALQRRRR